MIKTTMNSPELLKILLSIALIRIKMGKIKFKIAIIV
jgi:hypothetical protein